MRRSRAPDAVEAGNGTIEYVVTDEAELLQLSGPYDEPLRIQDPGDVLSAMDMLIHFMQSATELEANE